MNDGVVEHEHTEAECGHVIPNLPVMGVLTCWSCDEHEHDPTTPWCHARCAVFHAEVVESVKLAEREGDIPVFADEMMIDREDKSQ